MINGSTPMTGTLTFTGTANAGIQLSNLTDTQRAALSALDGMLIYNTTLSCLQYYNGAWLAVGTGGNAGWWNGAGAPATSTGNNGDYYLNTSNGSIYQKSSGSWSVIYSPSTNYLSASANSTLNAALTVGAGGSLSFYNTSGVSDLIFDTGSRIAFINGGSDQICGTATLNGTTAVTINTTEASASAGCSVFLSNILPGGTPGIPYQASMSNGSFTIKSTSSSDTSTVVWLMVRFSA
jgi:hypothetical protein